MIDDEPAAIGPVVDEATGDAELGRDLGEIFGSVPIGLGQLTIAEGNFSTQVRGSEANHDSVRKRPGLTTEVLDSSEFDTDLFADLAADGVLERFSGFNLHVLLLVFALVTLGAFLVLVVWLSVDSTLPDDAVSINAVPIRTHPMVPFQPFELPAAGR